MPLRLMAVHAHPDDESSKGAATMAMYVDRGVPVRVVSCTGGERGDILNPRLKDDPEVLRDLPELRRREMAAAQRILGIEHTWLGFVDSGLPEGDPLPPLPEGCFALEPLEVTTEALVRVIREFRPHVLTTYDEAGGYPHPDHVMCHDVSVAAFRAAGDPTRFPNAGPAWQPLKLYYNQTLTTRKLRSLYDDLTSRGVESPLGEWLERRSRYPERIGPSTKMTKVPAADYFGIRNQALLAHATQIDPDGFFFATPIEDERRVWPYEEYELAASYVPVVDDETDLFAGMGDEAEADRIVAEVVAGRTAPTYDVIRTRESKED